MASNTRLFTSIQLQIGGTIPLEKDTSHHLIKVLRADLGLSLELFNGDGFNYAATLKSIDNRKAVVCINSRDEALNESPLKITLLQGLSRGDRMDTTVQKCVELGVCEIVPVICERSNYVLKAERIDKKLAHWKKIIISACEQSGRSIIPTLSNVIPFHQAVESYDNYDKILLSTDARQTLSQIKKPDNTLCLFIGPEGGLSPDEVTIATAHHFKNIVFGPRVLRTETAGPAVISAMQTLWGDF